MTEELIPARSEESARTRRRILRGLGGVFLSMMLVVGMTGVFMYRQLSGNITSMDISDQLSDSPEKAGPKEAMNVLVMGSDSRDGEGNNIDGLTGDGQRSDTTMLMHIAADRSYAYSISLPRDALIDRPDCIDKDGETIEGASGVKFNEAFSAGGPACTVQTVQQLTGVKIDHFVVVDFRGFEDMVDAVDGVEVCLPQDIKDPAHDVDLDAGTQTLKGRDALNYVRVRYGISGGMDLGRMSRQQAFLASLVNKVVSAGTLARPDRLYNFLDATTQSLTTDPGLDNLRKLVTLGTQFQDVGLDNIQFVTTPNRLSGNDLYWDETAADELWYAAQNDEPLPEQFSKDAINADKVPGQEKKSDAGSSDSKESKKQKKSEAEKAEELGLCA